MACGVSGLPNARPGRSVLSNGKRPKFKLMQIDQRERVKGSMGCINKLLIDKAILADATKNAKNVLCVWVDVQMAFNSVSHNWFIYSTERLVAFIENIVILWKPTLIVPTVNGKETVGPIRIQCGILQGDSFCILLVLLYASIQLPGTWSQQGANYLC